MKKKISLLLCVLMIAFCFTGCSGSKTEESNYDITTLEQTAETVIYTFSNWTDENFASFKEFSEFQVEYMMLSNNLRISADDFLAMVQSWESAEDECGEYVAHGDYVTEYKSDGVVLTTSAEFEKKKATISFAFDESSYLKSMDVSAEYAFKEIIGKAGLNTILGMGTVFAVLIFLAFLIYLLKYIPVLLNLSKTEEKKEVKETPVATETVPETVNETVNENVEVTDDLELIAVITAAIAAAEGKNSDGFVVRSIRRRPSNKWN